MRRRDGKKREAMEAGGMEGNKDQRERKDKSAFQTSSMQLSFNLFSSEQVSE